jgi:hypoxanthine-DNA glycosylase
MTFKRSFAPVVDEHTRLLILGSLPGERSLAQAQYYAHPQNRFWVLLGAVLGVDLVALDYPQRLQQLLTHHVGLWDVVASARRSGSLDSQIREHTGNDIAGLVRSLPQLQAIAFNGGTAARHGLKQLGALAGRYAVVSLPSSSPAYTLPLERKLEAWRWLEQFCVSDVRPELQAGAG